MIHVVAHITTKPGMRAEVLKHFRANVPAVHAEDGCIEYRPVVDADGFGSFQTKIGDDSFFVIEKWRDADALKAQGAGKVVAYCTHPVLSGNALQNLNSSSLDELVVTDTIPLMDALKSCSKIRQLSMANLLAEAMRRVSNEESISAMFS